MTKKFLLLFFSLASFYLYSQNVYKEKFEDCSTKKFALESETETAKKDKNALIKLITQNIPENIQKKLRGKLKLQIIVYKDGTSCLLSYENSTTVNTDQLKIEKIKDIVDSKLVWINENKNVSALIELQFKKKKIVLKRYGMNAKSGWHELKK